MVLNAFSQNQFFNQSINQSIPKIVNESEALLGLKSVLWLKPT